LKSLHWTSFHPDGGTYDRLEIASERWDTAVADALAYLRRNPNPCLLPSELEDFVRRRHKELAGTRPRQAAAEAMRRFLIELDDRTARPPRLPPPQPMMG
jgi:hypothetical protein